MIVSPKLYGRLGNQMFQRAAAKAYALRHGVDYTDNEELFSRITRYRPAAVVKEEGHHYTEPPVIKKGPGILFDGYFQSEKYFSDFANSIKEFFGAPQHNNHWDIAIHVRRGDYLLYPDKHPTMTISYYAEGIREILERTTLGNWNEWASISVAIFTDDYAYCDKVLRPALQELLPGSVALFIMHPGDPNFDQFQMSKARHQVISNSTFSWWAAYLNPNPNKIIISPNHQDWFGRGNSHLATHDIIPDSWIQIGQ